jgi:Na+/H+-dicarboxylate symporter
LAESDLAVEEPSNRLTWSPLTWPLYLRVLLGVITGALIGYYFHFQSNNLADGTKLPVEIIWGWTTSHLGDIAKMYIDLLTTLATPLIFFAVAEAFVRTVITRRQGVKMFTICTVNIVVAFVIGLSILNYFQPGKAWTSAYAEHRASATEEKELTAEEKQTRTIQEQAKDKTLSPLVLLRSYIPKSVVQPFSDNVVLTVALLAILVGAALRSLKNEGDEQLHPSLVTLEHLIIACYQIILRLLMWLIELAPFAICLAVIDVIGRAGLGTFQLVGVFFLTTVSALMIHSLIYYPLSSWLIGWKSPRDYFRYGLSAILTGFSINSSLATAPLTLDALKKLGVSDSSARLSACVGTNFNNDGITLYEAMTALFIAQAVGKDLALGSQVSILLAALAGSMGIAGIPNSGLIILTLVLRAAKLDNDAIQFAFPIVLSIDFIIARLRSAVNVMGDLQVAILLDAGTQEQGTDAAT